MRTLEGLRRRLFQDPGFPECFRDECHVCRHTLAIFARLHAEGPAPAELAAELALDPTDLQALADADRCDPRQVIRICRHLGLPPPERCPRLDPRD
jgi:hypothetical protein